MPKDEHPYTNMLRDKILKEIEKLQLEQASFTNDMNVGLRQSKEIIISKIKSMEL